jgi:hypothetical protein
VNEIKKAFVIGGFSEDHAFLEAFTRAICEGENRIVEDAESITLAEAYRNRGKLNTEAAHRIVFPHSAGNEVIRQAGIFVGLNPIEPTPFLKTILRGIKVANNHEIGREDHVAKPSPISGFVEVVKHPSNLKAPLIVRKFSTVQMLVDGGTEAFPEGRLYLPTRQDEFGFSSDELVTYAKIHGITSEMLDGYHNQPLLHPRAAVAQISGLLNAA